MYTNADIISNLTSKGPFMPAVALTIIFIWLIVVWVIIKSKSSRKNLNTIVVETYPPQDISPAFARFILVSGREGGMVGEISRTGMQILTFINLYEDGLFKKLKMVDETTIEYEIHENYASLPCAEDERLFIDALAKDLGMKNVLKEDAGRHARGKENGLGWGFPTLSKTWYKYWHKDLNALADKKGYMLKTSKFVHILSIFAGSLTFGLFFSVFLSFIPYIGTYITAFLLLPVLVLFGISYGISYLAFAQMHTGYLMSEGFVAVIQIIGFLSWFTWFIILGQRMTLLARRLTPSGLELVRKLEGYKKFLKTVDQGRISFSFNRDIDFERNQTSFSWLAIFGLVRDAHWDEWYKVAGDQMGGQVGGQPRDSLTA